ncbi:PSME3 protein, partial [Polyodon spathula]|nr:PSME3 protein [Polyodon spathula]
MLTPPLTGSTVECQSVLSRFTTPRCAKLDNLAGILPEIAETKQNSELARRYQLLYVQQGTKVFVMPNGMMRSNKQLVDLIEKVKPEIRTLIEKCNTVKMWVQLLIPRIEDGNNFGVSIQEETVAELRTVEGEAASYLDQISRYYITRAKLVSKIAKYPHVEDYRRTVTEIDEKEYISLKIIVSELRNQYVTLHDMILKNIEKIKRPRNSNAETLY